MERASFVDLRDGFGLADGSVVSTFDGGLSWTAVATAAQSLHVPGFDYNGGSEPDGSGIVFSTTQRGWVWGASRSGDQATLSSTADGGYHWAEVPHLTGVVAVVPNGASIWVFTSPPSGATSGSGGLAALWVSSDDGTTWHRSPAAIPAGGGSIPDAYRASPTVGYAIIQPPGSPAGLNLVETIDSGATWVGRPSLPIGCSFEGSYLSGDASQLWLACGAEPGAGEQAKVIYRSADSGATWRLVAASQGPTGQPVTGTLSLGGYILQLAAVSPTVAYLALGRGPLLETTDGGTTWNIAAANYESGGLGAFVAPITPTTAVALIAGQSWRTTNGTTWAPTT
ncbi:MAG: hypothetical protein M3Y91_06165 [Actinomycetota bacterium]|nr:hypothetical protein [Actinomycetota bacterium]